MVQRPQLGPQAFVQLLQAAAQNCNCPVCQFLKIGLQQISEENPEALSQDLFQKITPPELKQSIRPRKKKNG